MGMPLGPIKGINIVVTKLNAFFLQCLGGTVRLVKKLPRPHKLPFCYSLLRSYIEKSNEEYHGWGDSLKKKLAKRGGLRHDPGKGGVVMGPYPTFQTATVMPHHLTNQMDPRGH